MAITTLTFIRSDEEITSGIPREITITSDILATIYFTLDGTVPTLDSAVYINPFTLPDAETSVILSAFGVDSEEESGPILTEVFAADTSDATVSRIVGSEGYVLRDTDSELGVSTGFDADSDDARFIDVNLEEIDIIKKGDLVVEVSYPDPKDTGTYIDDGFVPFSTPEFAEFFNPTANMIVIDNRIDNEVELIPRPNGSLYNVYTHDGGKRVRSTADESSYMSGGFGRRFYSAKTNTMVSYYYDHNNSHYIKNIQVLPDDIKTAQGGLNYTIPLVFKWLPRGRQSSI